MAQDMDINYINDAVKTVYMTYINGETAEVQLSFALTLLVNTIEKSGMKQPMLNSVYEALDTYTKTDNIMDLANGNKE